MPKMCVLSLQTTPILIAEMSIRQMLRFKSARGWDKVSLFRIIHATTVNSVFRIGFMVKILIEIWLKKKSNNYVLTSRHTNKKKKTQKERKGKKKKQFRETSNHRRIVYVVLWLLFVAHSIRFACTHSNRLVFSHVWFCCVFLIVAASHFTFQYNYVKNVLFDFISLFSFDFRRCAKCAKCQRKSSIRKANSSSAEKVRRQERGREREKTLTHHHHHTLLRIKANFVGYHPIWISQSIDYR